MCCRSNVHDDLFIHTEAFIIEDVNILTIKMVNTNASKLQKQKLYTLQIFKKILKHILNIPFEHGNLLSPLNLISTSAETFSQNFGTMGHGLSRSHSSAKSAHSGLKGVDRNFQSIHFIPQQS